MRGEQFPDPGKRTGAPAPESKKKHDNAQAERQPLYETRELRDRAPSGEERRTITNTDEQNNITNSSNDPFDEKEREGD
jgi:hypothetical protein